MKLEFVDDVKSWWRWWSMQALAVLAAIQLAWQVLNDTLTPEEIAALPGWMGEAYLWSTIVLTLAAAAGRVVKQPKLNRPGLE